MAYCQLVGCGGCLVYDVYGDGGLSSQGASPSHRLAPRSVAIVVSELRMELIKSLEQWLTCGVQPFVG